MDCCSNIVQSQTKTVQTALLSNRTGQNQTKTQFMLQTVLLSNRTVRSQTKTQSVPWTVLLSNRTKAAQLLPKSC